MSFVLCHISLNTDVDLEVCWILRFKTSSIKCIVFHLYYYSWLLWMAEVISWTLSLIAGASCEFDRCWQPGKHPAFVSSPSGLGFTMSSNELWWYSLFSASQIYCQPSKCPTWIRFFPNSLLFWQCSYSTSQSPNPNRAPGGLQFQLCSDTPACVFHVTLKTLMSWFWRVWLGLELSCRKLTLQEQGWSSTL